MGEMGNTYNMLVRKPEKEEATWKTWCRCEYDIIIYFKQIGGEGGVDWTRLAGTSGRLLLTRL
jgi:hypothetical protein